MFHSFICLTLFKNKYLRGKIRQYQWSITILAINVVKKFTTNDKMIKRVRVHER